MEKILAAFSFLILSTASLCQDIYFEPVFVEAADAPVRLYVDITSTSCSCPELLDADPVDNPIYIWTWSPNNARPDVTVGGETFNVLNGEWGNSNENLRMQQDPDNSDLWYYDFVGTSLADFYDLPEAAVYDVGIEFLIKEKDGEPVGEPEQKSPDLSLELNFQNSDDFSISHEMITSDISNPTTITHAGDERIFVTEQPGTIKVFYRDGAVESEPFLDIQDRVQDLGGEQGLLGLAFEPDFCESGRFYVNYTANDGGLVTRISRFSLDEDNPTIGNPDSEEILIQFDQDFQNHNGGHIEFGPDGYLYIGTGDGGSGGDPNNRAQDITSLLGKMLRIDISPETGYEIPSDNPYIFDDFGQDEIWSYGLRNPWKYAFDRELGNLYIADVGQNAFEEVNFEPFNAPGGRNYGWRCYEGENDYNLSGCNASDYVFPISTYPHSGVGCTASVTGGRIYRGPSFEAFQGWYFYTDFCTGVHWAVTQAAGETIEQDFGTIGLGGVRTYGEDVWGEVYMGNGSGIHRLLNPDEGEVLNPIQQEGSFLSPLGMFEDASYEWFLDGDFIGNPAMIQISETGEYTLVITTASGCTIETSSEITSLSSTDFNSGSENLKVYPNPAEEFVFIELDPYGSEARSLAVYSIDGRLIQARVINSNRMELDLSDYANGVYIIHLLDMSGHSLAKSKLIRQ